MEQKTMTLSEGVTSLLASIPREAPEEKPQEKPAETEVETPEPAEASEQEADEAEDTGTEGEGEDGDEGDGEDEAPPQTFRVNIDGVEQEVTYDDLVKGYHRGHNYETKAERARQAEAAAQAALEDASGKAKQYSEYLSALESLLSQEDPDLQKLKQEDPQRYLLAKMDREEAMKRVKAERERVDEDRRKQDEANRQKWAQDQRAKVPVYIPEWRDAGRVKAEAPQVATYAKSIGFSDDEIKNLNDARALKVLRDAWLYNQGKAVKVKKKAPATKPLAAGAPKTKAEITGRAERDAMAKLKKSGRPEDGVAALLARSKRNG